MPSRPSAPPSPRSSSPDPVLFILGSGFNVDAASEAGYSRALPSGRPAQYPLVNELLKICFNIDVLPFNKSIEDLFQDSIEKGDKAPLDILYDYLMELDYYITPLLKRGGTHYNNVYIRFMNDFPKSPLITFNYDSLPEILLLAEKSWSPKDGYGIPVQFNQITIGRETLPLTEISQPVLHLHGSLCVYPSTFYFKKQPEEDYPIIQEYNEPKFIFDPDKLGNCFLPYERIPPGVTYSRVIERAIAPIPDKAEGLKGELITAVYKKTMELLNTATQIVVIGYSFNPIDHASYSKLLSTIIGKSVLLITGRDADTLKKLLSNEYPKIRWESQNMTFKEWVNNGYPGVRH